MISIDKTVLSDDIADNCFMCDLEKCKGACCVEGDLGAPLEKSELKILDEIYEKVAPYLTAKGREAIIRQGKYVFDEEGEYSTPTVNGKECAYAVYDDRGILKCAIEQAWMDKKIKFQKPISCHLYPIRITKYESYDALNYDRWEICLTACELGKKKRIPLYRFAKKALIRKYGTEWYDKLCSIIEQTEPDLVKR